VTPTELLALLGRAWSRLLLFPGGLAAFAAVALIAYAGRRGVPAAMQSARAIALAPPGFNPLAIFGAIAPPWLGLALLPLPPAPVLSRQTDLVVVLALLEAPLLLALARELSASDTAVRIAGRWRLVAALNTYPALVLASLALAQAAGTFDVAVLARPPAEQAPAFATPLHWIGAVAWALALVPALGLGPFAGPAGLEEARPRTTPESRLRSSLFRHIAIGPAFPAGFRFLAGALGGDPIQVGLRLRAIGLVLLAALPAMGAFGTLEEDGLGTWRGAVAWALAPLALAGLLWYLDRIMRGRAARPWAWAYLALDGALLAALLWAALLALLARLA
jgi:hypothetical protein